MAKIITADKSRTDGTFYEFLNRTYTLDIPILLLSRVDELDFNEDVLSLKGGEYVCMDMIENGWAWDRQHTLIVGDNTGLFDFTHNKGWDKLDEFMFENPPLIYFKRELIKGSPQTAVHPIYPIEYPIRWDIKVADYPVQTREQFNSRPISLFNYWGRSHEARLIQQANIWRHGARKGYAVCDNIYYLTNFLAEETNPNKLVTLWIPHYARQDIRTILDINSISKLSLSLPGAGINCFRSAESPINSIMLMASDTKVWSFPWVHGENSIQFEIGDNVEGVKIEWPVIETMEDALQREDLYEIYLRGIENAKNYEAESYMKNYIEPLINKA